MKRLDFTDADAPKRYEILYDALTNNARGFEAPAETRVLGKILDKMEAIGVATKRGESAREIATFTLIPGGGHADLEDAEYELFRDVFRFVKWMPKAAKDATAAVEWFQVAKEPPKPAGITEEA